MEYAQNVQRQLNNLAKNVESLAKAQGIPGEAIEGLLQLSGKDGFRYNTPKSYRARQGNGVDGFQLMRLANLFGVTEESLMGEGAVTSPNVEPFGIRLAAAVREYIEKNNLQENRLHKVFGRGKGKGITREDVLIALSPDERLPEPQKLRVICRKLLAAWFAPDKTAAKRGAEPTQEDTGEEKLPLTIENVEKVIEEIIPDPLPEMLTRLCGESDDDPPTEMDVARMRLAALWTKYVEEPRRAAAKENKTVEGAPQPPAENAAEELGEGIQPEKEVEEAMQRCSASTQQDIQKAITATRDICKLSGLKQYGFFALAGLPQSTEDFKKMNRPAYWSEELVQRYAEMLNAAPKAVLGQTQWDGTARNYGEIFARNFETAMELRGVPAGDVISELAKETERIPANLRKQILQSNSLPSYSDTCALMAITGLRLYDMLDWTGERAQQAEHQSELERLLETAPKSDWVPAATFQQNVKLLCEEANLTPSNLFWLVGVNDAKARASWARAKKVPMALIEACAKALGLTAAGLLSEVPLRLPAGTDFAAIFKTRFEKACTDAGMQLPEVAYLTDMAVRITTGKTALISSGTIDEKILSGEMLGKSNNTILTGLLAALQTTLNELVFPAHEKFDPTKTPCEWDFPADGQKPKSGGTATGNSRHADRAAGNGGATTQPAEAPQQAAPSVEPEADAGAELKPVVPPGASISVALRSCFNTPVPGADKWTVLRVTQKAAMYQKGITVRLMQDILDDKAEPTAAQLDAIIKVFFPEACQGIDGLEKSRRQFFARGMAAIVPQTNVCNTENWGMGRAGGAAFASTLRQLMDKFGFSVGALAKKLERVSHQDGMEAILYNLLANTDPDKSPSNELVESLAAIFGTTKYALCALSGISKDSEKTRVECSNIVKGISDPVKIQNLYYNMWAGQLLAPQ